MAAHIRSRLAVAATVLLGLTSGLAAAESARPLGVVELFTSQGCSSCPPADAVFTELSDRTDIVALAYHVDYWDYLGWKDTLSRPENTQRQYAYMRALRTRSVYTPQAVVNGATHVNGANRPALLKALDGTGPLSVPMSVTRSDESIVVEAGALAGDIGEAHLVLVYFEPREHAEITRGENTGRTIVYVNAVSGFQTVGMWHGQAARYEIPARDIADKAGSAVLLQLMRTDGSPGAILGAAMIKEPQPR